MITVSKTADGSSILSAPASYKQSLNVQAFFIRILALGCDIISYGIKRSWRSWIAHSTPTREVAGSNPVERTIEIQHRIFVWCFFYILAFYAYLIYDNDAGGLFGVEKVKPDPLNLLVKTNVGSNQYKEGI